jgi:hypothetical protein
MTKTQQKTLEWIHKHPEANQAEAKKHGISYYLFYRMKKVYKNGTSLAKQEETRREKPRNTMAEVIHVLTSRFGPPTMTFYSQETGTEIVIRGRRGS